MSKTDFTPSLTSEMAAEILNKTLEALQTPENIIKLDEARDKVGNDMVKIMQYVFPEVMQIQMDVIKEFGFPEGREGIIKFAMMLRALEREDEDVARLHNLVKAYYLPPVAVNATAEGTADERVASS